MGVRYYCLFFLVLAAFVVMGKSDLADQRTKVALRMVGHQILLHSGDDSSRVLPIVMEGGSYKLQFDTPFLFEPEDLVAIVDSVVDHSGIAHSYLVEVKECATGEVVYSYEAGLSHKLDVVPCIGRVQPSGCYEILFTVLPAGPSPIAGSSSAEKSTSESTRENRVAIAWLAVPVLLLFGWIGVARGKKRKPHPDSNLIPIGAFRFDRRNMDLLFENQKTELTSKEADLLYLLYSSANETLERDYILNAVWGDGGDYIGRTLDVFISKLRKKLEADPSVKIVNIRGVGYRLVMNGVA